MKNVFIILLVISFNSSLKSQNFRGLDKSPLDMVNFPASSQVQEKLVRVLYSRPQLNGRDLKRLTPNGKLWRTGANESTEITFFKEVKIGSSIIPSGRYTLYSIPNETFWTIIINKKVNTWGAYAYDSSQDVMRTNVPIVFSNESLEAFSIAITGKEGDAKLHMGWDKLRVSLPIEF